MKGFFLQAVYNTRIPDFIVVYQIVYMLFEFVYWQSFYTGDIFLRS